MRTVITVGALISLAGCYPGPARPPLVRAASGSDIAEVEQLLEKGADPNVCQAPEGVTELSPLAAAAAGGNVEVVVALLRGVQELTHDAAVSDRLTSRWQTAINRLLRY
jgi:hypothetical protein